MKTQNATAHRIQRLRKFLVYVLVITGSSILILPFVWMILSAFKTTDEILKLPIQWLPEVWQFGNFERALEVQPIVRQLGNTAFLAVLKIIGEVFVSAMVAYGFARFEFRGKNALFLILLATLMLPYEVVMIPTFILWTTLGFYDSYVPLALPAYFGAPAFIFFLRMYFETFPRELEDSALVDGASWLQIFIRIFIPLGKPALITIGLWAFMGTWNDLLGQLIYIASEDRYTIQLGLASFSSMTGQTLWGPLMAASLMALAPILVLLLFAQKYFMEGIKTSGIKG
jgi:multiple sugar transport system permease protein